MGDGNKMLDVMGVLLEGDDCFLDVEAIDGNKNYPVKLIASDSMQIPIAAIMPSGKNLPIVGVTAMGETLPVKGISRFGNTIRITIIEGGAFRDVYAYSDSGTKGLVTGANDIGGDIALVARSTVVGAIDGAKAIGISAEEAASAAATSAIEAANGVSQEAVDKVKAVVTGTINGIKITLNK